MNKYESTVRGQKDNEKPAAFEQEKTTIIIEMGKNITNFDLCSVVVS